jgi:putative DNA primase/helicase
MDDCLSALSFIPPDLDREEWLKVMMAFKSEYPDRFDIIDGWSQGADCYSARECAATWRSITPNGGINIATLFHIAKSYGWQTDKPPVRVVKPSRNKAPKPKHDTLPYAMRIWGGVNREDEVVAKHPYAQRKKITHAFGAGRSKASGKVIGNDADCLVIPIRTFEDELIGVQCINSAGKKQIFGKVGVLQLGNTLNKSLPIYVVEGFADGVSAWRLFGDVVVVVAFSKSRLMTVAENLDAKYPRRIINVVEDNDDRKNHSA